MSLWTKLPETCGGAFMMGQRAGAGTLASLGKLSSNKTLIMSSWSEPVGRDRWSSKDNYNNYSSKSMSTCAKKLQCEEELRRTTLQVPLDQIVKGVIRNGARRNGDVMNRIYNEL